MQKDNGFQAQNLDHVLHDAQLRRANDLGVWLKQYLDQRRQRRLRKELSSPPSVPASLHRQAF